MTARAGHQPAVDAFHEAFRQRYGATPSWNGKTVKQLRVLVQTHTLAEVLRRIDILFSDAPAWISEPYTVGLLVGTWDHLVIPATAARRVAQGLDGDDLRAMAERMEEADGGSSETE